MGEGGAHLEIGAGLFERAAGTRPTMEQMKDFIDAVRHSGRCSWLCALLNTTAASVKRGNSPLAEPAK